MEKLRLYQLNQVRLFLINKLTFKEIRLYQTKRIIEVRFDIPKSLCELQKLLIGPL